MHHFINGDYLQATEAKIPINDLAVLRGYGVFDYFRTYNRKPFLFDSYFKRFENSAAIANLKIPYNRQEIENIVHKLISLNDFEECGVRMVLTGGTSPDASTSVEPNFFILIDKFAAPSEFIYTKGAHVISYEYQRDLPKAKLLNYASSIIFNSKNADKNATEILYHSQGKISEASRSNFFIIQGERLITAGEQILHGITRNTVLELAKNHFEIKMENFPIKSLHLVNEAFISSSNKGIMPVVQVDGVVIGTGRVGKGTSKLMDLYKDFVEEFKNIKLK